MSGYYGEEGPPRKRRRGPMNAALYASELSVERQQQHRRDAAASVLQNKFRALVKGAYVRSPGFVFQRSARIQRHEHTRFRQTNPLLDRYRYMAVSNFELGEPLVEGFNGLVPNPFAFGALAFDEGGGLRRFNASEYRRLSRDHLMERLIDFEFNRHSLLANRYVSLVERAVDRRADRRHIEAGERLSMGDEDININV